MNETHNVYEKIEDIVGTKYVSESELIRYSYSMNCDTVLKGIPEIVVRPSSREEISEILKIANVYHVKITPRGGGADLCGGSKPIGNGGVVLDLTRMDKILDIDEKNQVVSVEVGISWSELCEQLSKIGEGYYTGSTGPGSGFSATIGGGLSNNSSGGGGAAMYGNVTEQCVGMEVVLPTGEIIYTGAKANSFCKKQFTRFGLGADYSGIFLGDAGIHGIKTKASLNLYPLPEYAAYSTFEISKDEEMLPPEKAAKVMMKWQHDQLPMHDFYYFPRPFVGMFKSFGMIEGLKEANVRGSLLFYTTVADSQKQLDYNVERIEKIAKDENFRKLGQKVEDGNIGRWFYEENGRWQYAHVLYGGSGANYSAGASCIKCPTYKLPEYINLFRTFNRENRKRLREADSYGAAFFSFGVHPNYIDLEGGFPFVSNPEKRN